MAMTAEEEGKDPKQVEQNTVHRVAIFFGLWHQNK
jgi:hypothetical protein